MKDGLDGTSNTDHSKKNENAERQRDEEMKRSISMSRGKVSKPVRLDPCSYLRFFSTLLLKKPLQIPVLLHVSYIKRRENVRISKGKAKKRERKENGLRRK